MASKLSPTVAADSAPPSAPRGERTERRPAGAQAQQHPANAPRPGDARPSGARTNEPPPTAIAPPDVDRSSSRAGQIATAAYYRAEKRGFAPGCEQEDWLAAEREVDGAGDVPLV